MSDDGVPADDLIRTIGEFVTRMPHPSGYATKDEFMRMGVDAMNELLRLAMVAVSLIRPNARAFTKRHAPIVGLTVRMIKLYHGILRETAERHAELADVYRRPFLEAHVRCTYLMQNGRASAKSYIETSYRPEREMLQHLNALKRQRPLIPIEKRMRRSILSHIRDAGISQKRLIACTRWELDGKNMRALLESIGWSLAYSFGFASSSHSVHGSWYDLVVHHVHRDGRSYLPELHFTTPDPRMIAPASITLVEHLRAYVRYFSLDPDKVIHELLGLYGDYFREFDRCWQWNSLNTWRNPRWIASMPMNRTWTNWLSKPSGRNVGADTPTIMRC